MRTNNEKGQGSSRPKSNTGASRDGKSFDKRDVKSLLKGSRGAGKYDNDRPSRDEYRGDDSRDFKRKDDNYTAYGERKSYGSTDNKPSFGHKKPWENRDSKPSFGDRKPYGDRDSRQSTGERKPWENRDSKPSFGAKKPWEKDSKPAYGDRKPWEDRDSKPSFSPKKPWDSKDGKPAYGDRKPFEKRDGGRPTFGAKKPWEARDSKPSYGERKPWDVPRDSNGEKRYGRIADNYDDEPRTGKLDFRKNQDTPKSEYRETRFDDRRDGVSFRKRNSDDSYDPNAKYSQKKQLAFKKNTIDFTKPVRLNKFIANAGICSRREADEYIQAGVISVNGQIVTELGVKVMLTDKVMFHEQPVHSERKVYLLLNKPKDCVTTSEDTHERLTVLDLVKNACSERIYPVGRLDRNTTGVLLLTNDGDLASKLTHPKYDKKKVYHVTLDKPLEEVDYTTILSGVALEDCTIAADALEYVKEGDPKQVGIEIHSGQNRVVRRIFEKLGYKVIRLDRVFFAGLTKKNLPRGKFRFLTLKEVEMLKMGAHE
jgi:23S rRNA pseudouridine2605 synthase